MRKYFQIIGLTFTLSTAVAGAPTDGDKVPISGLREGCSLVSAVADEPDLKSKSVRFRVEHVFAGEALPVGSTFVGGVSTGSDSTGSSIDPIPTEGEHGIWVVQRIPQGLFCSRNLGPMLGFAFPAREGVSARWDQEQQLAKTVERVSHIPAVDAPKLLRSLAQDHVEEVEVWASMALAARDPHSAMELALDEASAARISAAGQAALDGALLEQLPGDWVVSPARSRMLVGWQSRTKQDDYNVDALVQHLDLISQHLDPKDKDTVPGLVHFAEDRDCPTPSRWVMIKALARLIARKDAHAPEAKQALEKLSQTLEPAELRAVARDLLAKPDR